MKTPQEWSKHFLSQEIPTDKLQQMGKAYHVKLEQGITFKGAYYVILKQVAAGDSVSIAAVKRHGLPGRIGGGPL